MLPSKPLSETNAVCSALVFALVSKTNGLIKEIETKEYIELFTLQLTLVFNIRHSNNINEIFISCIRKIQ